MLYDVSPPLLFSCWDMAGAGGCEAAARRCVVCLLRLQPLSAATAMHRLQTCDGDMLRYQVLNGSLWVQTVTDRRGAGS